MLTLASQALCGKVAGTLGGSALRQIYLIICAGFIWLNSVAATTAQDLTIATVSRPPFSQFDGNVHTGFSIDLMNAIAADLGRDVRYDQYDVFADMLEATEIALADAAIANISITAEREMSMDFSQPMFDSGIQVMLPADTGLGFNVFGALMTREFAVWAGAALAVLLSGGFLMWLFERGRQSWFDRPASEAFFPSFWWALNLMLNGGFEERMPASRMGRLFAVFLVIASLFFVSIFVAQITAALTIEAINDNVADISDLDDKRVGTIDSSTSAEFLDGRGITYRNYLDLADLLDAFEGDELDAVVFDGPILAYYAATSVEPVEVLDKVYRPENYGIAFPSGSPLREQVNQSILRLREQGIYQNLLIKWFGPIYNLR
jgi:polar amino acid transport system substrate-binding protein